LKVFPPALLGRLSVVPYFPLGDQVVNSIIKLQLDRVARRVRENHKAEFVYDPALVELIASRCKESESGARNIDAIITRNLLPEISQEFLTRMAAGEPITSVHVGTDEKGGFAYKIG
jgi:type VI secretion system protein VasG